MPFLADFRKNDALLYTRALRYLLVPIELYACTSLQTLEDYALIRKFDPAALRDLCRWVTSPNNLIQIEVLKLS